MCLAECSVSVEFRQEQEFRFRFGKPVEITTETAFGSLRAEIGRGRHVESNSSQCHESYIIKHNTVM